MKNGTKTDEAGYAFPRPGFSSYSSHAQTGLSARTYIAVEAMKGFLSGNPKTSPLEEEGFYSKIAKASFQMADAMIEEGKK